MEAQPEYYKKDGKEQIWPKKTSEDEKLDEQFPGYYTNVDNIKYKRALKANEEFPPIQKTPDQRKELVVEQAKANVLNKVRAEYMIDNPGISEIELAIETSVIKKELQKIYEDEWLKKMITESPSPSEVLYRYYKTSKTKEEERNKVRKEEQLKPQNIAPVRLVFQPEQTQKKKGFFGKVRDFFSRFR